MREMTRFLQYFVDYTQDLFFENGGPVILLQGKRTHPTRNVDCLIPHPSYHNTTTTATTITTTTTTPPLLPVENEYGLVEKEYGSEGHEYIEWAGELTRTFNTTLPWIMCQQDNVPSVINTCNGFYCDNWLAHSRAYRDQPGMFTEDWTGWFMAWGDVKPLRPAEDIAFGVARWIARGGTYHAHYMWHGGTNFGRYAGGNPALTTSYDYDAPVDEYGMATAKMLHIQRLQLIVLQYQDLLLNYEKMHYFKVKDDVEAHIFGDFNTENSIMFLSNSAASGSDTQVHFKGGLYTIPRWSVSIIRGPANGHTVLYNTAKMSEAQREYSYRTVSMVSLAKTEVAREPIGVWNEDAARYRTMPLEQIGLTRDTTDYLWYVLRPVRIPAGSEGSLNLTFAEVQDHVIVYWNGALVGRSRGGKNLSFTIPRAMVQPGNGNTLQVLSQVMGISNFGAHRQTYARGIMGDVMLNGQDISEDGWTHQVGLLGEKKEVSLVARCIAFLRRLLLQLLVLLDHYNYSYYLDHHNYNSNYPNHSTGIRAR